MKKRTRNLLTRVLPAVLFGAALVATALWGAARAREAKAMAISAENNYKRAAYTLCESVNSMEGELAKLMVAGTPSQHVLLLSELARECAKAEGLLSELPASHGETMELNRFLVRMGDYAHALCIRILRGENITGEEREQLSDLHESAAQLSLTLTERMENGDLPLAALTGEEYYAAPTAGSDVQQSGLEELPTLIYDGPFSESSEKREPLGLPEREVSESEAIRTASALMGEGASLSAVTVLEGEIPCYDITMISAEGKEVSFSVTKRGGKLLTMMGEASGGKEGVPEQEEAERLKRSAAAYLTTAGFADMTSTYAQYYAGMAVINFAAEQDGVILYSDLVKVWVDRETFTVIGLDAKNYWYSHRERQLPAPLYSEEDARGMVSDALNVQDTRLALIPVTPVTEKLCYEFKGEYAGSAYIVYINAETLYEEQIFKIIDDENGQLVI